MADELDACSITAYNQRLVLSVTLSKITWYRNPAGMEYPKQIQEVDRGLQEDASALRHLTLRLGWETERYLTHAVSVFQLTLPQFMVMAALRHHRQGLTMSELAAATNQVAATMTGIVDRLVERNLVNRKRDPQDRRALRVSLTADGKSLLIQVEKKQTAELLPILSPVSPEDRREMVRLMQLYLEMLLAPQSKGAQT
jgi:DNA-binding MarR family transcriptional regulator